MFRLSRFILTVIILVLTIHLSSPIYPKPNNDFYRAINNNDLNTATRIVKEKEFDVNKVDDNRGRKTYKFTPLHGAAIFGYASLAKLLIKKGAKVNSIGGFIKETPLHLASVYGHIEVVKVLLDNKANLSAENTFRHSPLHYAVSGKNRKDIVTYLIKKGANVNALTVSNYTPLHIAASEGTLEVVMLLCENGADLNAKNKKGQKPVDLARKRFKWEIAEYLKLKNKNSSK